MLRFIVKSIFFVFLLTPVAYSHFQAPINRDLLLQEALTFSHINTIYEIRALEALLQCMDLPPQTPMKIVGGWDPKTQDAITKTVPCQRFLEYFIQNQLNEFSIAHKSLFLLRPMHKTYQNAEEWFYDFFSRSTGHNPYFTTTLKSPIQIAESPFANSKDDISVLWPLDFNQQNLYIKELRDEVMGLSCNQFDINSPNAVTLKETISKLSLLYKIDDLSFIPSCTKKNPLSIQLITKKKIAEQDQNAIINTIKKQFFRWMMSHYYKIVTVAKEDYNYIVLKNPLLLLATKNHIDEAHYYLEEKTSKLLHLRNLLSTLLSIHRDNIKYILSLKKQTEWSKEDIVILSTVLLTLQETIKNYLFHKNYNMEHFDEHVALLTKEAQSIENELEKKEMTWDYISLGVCIGAIFIPHVKAWTLSASKVIGSFTVDTLFCTAVTAVPRSFFLFKNRKIQRGLLSFYTPLHQDNTMAVSSEDALKNIKKIKWTRLIL